MLGKPIRIGKLFNIDLTVSWSFLALVAVLSLYLALQSSSFILGLVSGLVSLALVFGSVVAHELGHSLVAQRLGVRIAEIELHFFGGAAKMLSMPKSPRDEILIAAAGPVVSLTMAGVFGLLTLGGVEALGLVSGLAYINLMLGTFNLIPALPTDGGRILRAALSRKYGNLGATRIAVKVARVATIGLGIWALASGNFFALGVAVFIWMLGSRELQLAEALHRHGGTSYGRGYTTESFAPDASLVEVYDRDGRFIGMAPGGVEQTAPRRVPFGDGLGGGSTRSGKHPLADLFDALRHDGPSTERHYYVRGPDGRLWVVREGRSSSWPA